MPESAVLARSPQPLVSTRSCPLMLPAAKVHPSCPLTLSRFEYEAHLHIVSPPAVAAAQLHPGMSRTLCGSGQATHIDLSEVTKRSNLSHYQIHPPSLQLESILKCAKSLLNSSNLKLSNRRPFPTLANPQSRSKFSILPNSSQTQPKHSTRKVRLVQPQNIPKRISSCSLRDISWAGLMVVQKDLEYTDSIGQL